jgi:hypothetical protein
MIQPLSALIGREQGFHYSDNNSLSGLVFSRSRCGNSPFVGLVEFFFGAGNNEQNTKFM